MYWSPRRARPDGVSAAPRSGRLHANTRLVKAYLAAWPAGCFAWALGSLEHPICLQLGLWRRDGVAALRSAGMAALAPAYTAALAT
jgi:hypothetical protein